MQTVTASEMKKIECHANENGLSYTQMMYNAGTKAAEYILQNTEQPNGKIVLILTGRGNNGGDGYVAALKLKEDGFAVLVLMAEGLPKTEDAQKYFSSCQEVGIEILHFEAEKSAILFMGADIIIDAIYGTGFHGRLNDTVRTIAQLVNNSDAKVYALDLPSGLNADTGEADLDTIRANATIAFHLQKPAHVQPSSKPFCGKIYCADIGIPYMI